MKKFLLFLFINISFFAYSVNFSELRGIVLDSVTLEPVSNVKVYVEDEITYTDSRGEFYVQALISGANLVRLDKDMYKEFSKVSFLYKGHNSKKFVIAPLYGKSPEKKVVRKEKEPQIIEREPVKIEKSFPEIKNDTDCDLFEKRQDIEEQEIPDYCNEEIKVANNTIRSDSSLNTIIGIVNRISGEISVHGEVREKNSRLPVSDIPVFFGDKVVFTDENGKFSVKTMGNNAEITIDCRGYEKYTRKFDFERDENHIEIEVVNQGGNL